MEFHQLKYFVAVSEARSFSRAAERVRVSQPSLSQQILKLEAEVGRPLFDRLARQVTLTEAGHGLLPHAKRILSQLQEAQQFLNDYEEEPGGLVRVGLIPTIAPYVLGPLLAASDKQFPRLALAIVEDVTDNLVRCVTNGEIDLAIISTCRAGPAMGLEPCLREPLLVALPERHALAKRPQLRWQDLRKETIVLLHESHCLSEQIRKWCHEREIRTKEDVGTLQLPSLLAMVAAGRGCTFIPAMASQQLAGCGCVFAALRTAGPSREINLLRNTARYQSKAAVALCQLTRDLLQSNLQPMRPDSSCSVAHYENTARFLQPG